VGVGWAAASAPGKVILFGEHFVVKGARSLTATVSLRARAEVSPGGPGITVESPRLHLNARIDPETLEPGDPRLEPLARLLAHLRGMGYSVEPHRVRITSEIPPGAGLGSSASVAAAYALAYTAAQGAPLEGEALIGAAYEAERAAHGRPSGVDNTVVVLGGGIVYRRGSGFQPVSVRLPEGTVMLVVDTGVARSTREVVADVLARAEATWEASKHLYRAADEIVGLALDAIQRGDARLLGELMDLNQGLLNALGASSLPIEKVVFAARAAGALGAKLTGAGRGGAVLVLAPEARAREVEAAVAPHAARVYRVALGVEGARIEYARPR